MIAFNGLFSQGTPVSGGADPHLGKEALLTTGGQDFSSYLAAAKGQPLSAPASESGKGLPAASLMLLSLGPELRILTGLGQTPSEPSLIAFALSQGLEREQVESLLSETSPLSFEVGDAGVAKVMSLPVGDEAIVDSPRLAEGGMHTTVIPRQVPLSSQLESHGAQPSGDGPSVLAELGVVVGGVRFFADDRSAEVRADITHEQDWVGFVRDRALGLQLTQGAIDELDSRMSLPIVQPDRAGMRAGVGVAPGHAGLAGDSGEVVSLVGDLAVRFTPHLAATPGEIGVRLQTGVVAQVVPSAALATPVATAVSDISIDEDVADVRLTSEAVLAGRRGDDELLSIARATIDLGPSAKSLLGLWLSAFSKQASSTSERVLEPLARASAEDGSLVVSRFVAAADVSQRGAGSVVRDGINQQMTLLKAHEDYELLSRRLADSIAQRMGAEIARGGWSVQLQLQPAQLGWIGVRMVMADGVLRAQLKTSQGVTRDLVIDGLPRLREALEMNGFDVSSIEVALAGRQSSQGERDGAGQSAANPLAQPKTDVSDAVMGEDRTLAGAPNASPGALDLLV